jgi:hypothetical protein
MTTATQTFTTVFDSADVHESHRFQPDQRWLLEEDGEGRLYATSNAETRTLITSYRHAADDLSDIRRALLSYGVSEDVADRYIQQSGAELHDIEKLVIDSNDDEG